MGPTMDVQQGRNKQLTAHQPQWLAHTGQRHTDSVNSSEPSLPWSGLA